MNKSDIINLVCEKNNLGLPDVEYSIKKIIDYMSENLYQGERIEIRGFGTFSLHTHQSRLARNPKTGEIHSISPRKSLSFIASKKLSNKINLD